MNTGHKIGYALLYAVYAGWALFAVYWWLHPAEYSPVFVAIGIAGIIATLLLRALVGVLLALLRVVSADPLRSAIALGVGSLVVAVVYATVVWWDLARFVIAFGIVWSMVFWAWEGAGRLFKGLKLRPAPPRMHETDAFTEGAVLGTEVNEYSIFRD